MKSLYRSFLTCVFACLLYPLTAQAQVAVYLSGTVTDQVSSGALPNEPVTIIIDSINGYVYGNSVVTDINGFYEDTIFIPAVADSGMGLVRVFDCQGGAVDQTFSWTPTDTTPVVDFSICADTNCFAGFGYTDSANVITFINTSTNTPPDVNYLWDFGDGSFSSLENPVHTFAPNATYFVCLTIFDSTNTCNATFCSNVIVGSAIICTANWVNVFSGGNSYQFNHLSTGTTPTTEFLWDFGDGSTDTARNPFHDFVLADTYTVCMTISDTATGCFDVHCDTVQASGLAACQPGFTSSVGSYGIVDFTNISTGVSNTTQISWDFGDGNTSTDVSPTNDYVLAGTYVVCLSLSDTANNCNSTICDTVVVPDSTICQADFDFTPTTHFAIDFSNNSTGTTNNTTFSWDFGDGNTSTNPDPGNVYPALGLYIACLTINNPQTGCTDTYCDSVIVNSDSLCQGDFTFNVTPSGTVDFSNFSANITTNTTYSWDFGDGNTSNLEDPTNIFASDGSYNVCLTLADTTTGCTDIYCDSVTLNAADFCQANFLASANQNGQVTFVNSSTNTTGSATYFWDFGDGNTSNQMAPVHTYSSIGNYNVCLTIADTSNNCSDTFCDSVLVNGSNICQAGFTFNVDTTGVTSFTNISSNTSAFTVFTWDFGDGNGSNAINPSYTYSQVGTYLVCLTISDSVSGCTNTFCDSVTINQVSSCFADFGVSYNGNAVIFSDSSTANSAIIGWAWDFGDGNTSTQQNPAHSYLNAGLYNVCLTITSANNCSNSICMQVQANGPSCFADFSAQLQGSTVFFQDQSVGAIGGLSYFWDLGDGTLKFDSSFTHTYNNPGDYVVCLTIVDSLTNCSDVHCDTVSITVNTPCQAGFVANQVGSQTFNFINNSVGINANTTYSWAFGDGSSSTAVNPTHSYTAPGTYFVCLTIEDIGTSCQSQFCDSVTVQSGGNCIADFNFTFSGSDVVFSDASNTTNPVVSYDWDFGDGNTSNVPGPTHTYAVSGNYTVCMTIMTSDSCIDVVCKQVQATGGSPCQADFFTQPDPTGTYAILIYENSSANVTVNYTWSFGDGNQSPIQFPTHTYAAAGTYQVCLTINDNAATCVSTYCENVTITDPSKPMIVLSGANNLEEALEESVVLFPNPVQDRLSLRFDGQILGEVEVSIVDVSGRILQGRLIEVNGQQEVDLDVADLPAGVYSLRLRQENAWITKRFLIRK